MKRSALGAASAERAGIMSEGNILLRFTIVGRLRRDRGQVSMWTPVNGQRSVCASSGVLNAKFYLFIY